MDYGSLVKSGVAAKENPVLPFNREKTLFHMKERINHMKSVNRSTAKSNTVAALNKGEGFTSSKLAEGVN